MKRLFVLGAKLMISFALAAGLGFLADDFISYEFSSVAAFFFGYILFANMFGVFEIENETGA